MAIALLTKRVVQVKKKKTSKGQGKVSFVYEAAECKVRKFTYSVLVLAVNFLLHLSWMLVSVKFVTQYASFKKLKLSHTRIEGFTVADIILVVGQTRQNLQWMYGKNRDFDAR